ncbi:MAG: hypothetical protein V1748_12615 [Actinomycetota bacterium]
MCDNMGDTHMTLVLFFGGELDAGRVKRAFRLSLDAEPVLGCRFVERPVRPRWLRLEDLDRRLPFSTVEIGDTRRGAVEFAERPMDPKAGPAAEALLMRSGSDTLCVKVHHAAADAGGVKEYGSLLCSIYRRLAGDSTWVPSPNIAGDRTLRQVYRRIGLRARARSLRDGVSPRQTWGFPFPDLEARDRAFSVRRLGEKAPVALAERRARSGATVNDLLLTAYFRALCGIGHVEAGTRLPVDVPVDLRRYLPEGKAGAVCNLSGQLYPVLEHMDGEPFEGTLARVREVMGRFKENSPGIGSATCIESYLRSGFGISRRVFDRMVESMAGDGRATPFLSNFGVLSEGDFDVGGVPLDDAFIISPLMFPPSLLTGVTTFRDSMTMTVGYTGEGSNGPVIEEFLDLFERELT